MKLVMVPDSMWLGPDIRSMSNRLASTWDYVEYDELEGQHVYACRACGTETRTTQYGMLSLLKCKKCLPDR